MNNFKRILVYLITVILLLYSPLQVRADNGTGGGSGGGTGTNAGGASETKCGFRMYVVDYNGNLKSKVIDMIYQTAQVDIFMGTNRFGNGETQANDIYIMPSDMPRPYFHSGTFVGNGIAVKSWMRSDGADGVQNIIALIKKYLGDDVHDLFLDLSEEYYCVLEPITYHNIYTGNSSNTNSGISFYGTFYNWMQFYYENSLPNGGFTKQLDNNVLARCLTLEFDQPNLGLSMPTAGGLIDMNVLGTQGFGIQLYSNQDLSDGCSTYDEPLGDVPGNPPDESKGNYTIIKNYRIKTSSGYEDKGC